LVLRLNSKIEALDFDVETAAEEELFVNNEVGCHTAKLSTITAPLNLTALHRSGRLRPTTLGYLSRQAAVKI